MSPDQRVLIVPRRRLSGSVSRLVDRLFQKAQDVRGSAVQRRFVASDGVTCELCCTSTQLTSSIEPDFGYGVCNAVRLLELQ